jgi:hypothetical protein
MRQSGWSVGHPTYREDFVGVRSILRLGSKARRACCNEGSLLLKRSVLLSIRVAFSIRLIAVY